jgi:hypothetical protein
MTRRIPETVRWSTNATSWAAVVKRNCVVRLPAMVCVLILVVWSGWSSTLAQTQAGSPREAPVGHRQPTASSVPQEQAQTPAEKRQKELDETLDKKLRGICRGC